jgi:hypothetical protein
MNEATARDPQTLRPPDTLIVIGFFLALYRYRYCTKGQPAWSVC